MGVLFVACAALLVVVNREASELVLAQQEKGYAGSRLVDLFMKSKPFAAIPEGAVLVAPNLWDDISPRWEQYEPYWASYIRLHAGRHLQVVRAMPDLSQVPRVPGRMYYLEKQGSGMAGESVLLLSDLFVKNDEPADPRSRTIAVISARPFGGMGLVFQLASELPAEGLGPVTIGIPEAAPLHTQFDGTAFFSTLDVPETFLAGTAYVVAESAATSTNKMGRVRTRSVYAHASGGDFVAAVRQRVFGAGNQRCALMALE